MITEPATTFPVARCAPCGRDVLAHLWVDARDDERYACIHCDAELDPAELRWVVEAELAGAGYAVQAEREHCGRPDCGGGRCFR
jgi:DNA-directed RNA polymerase subunit RPC12/RpoP